MKLLDETDAQTILLIAPAGYGKTTLARQWASGQQGCAWHVATAGSRDVVVLARSIAEAAATVSGGNPSLFNEFLGTIKNPARDVRRISATLADACACSKLRTLVIDDYHLLVGSEAEEIIDFLRTHSRLRILITSRRRPTWASAREIVYGEACELTRVDLMMTTEESLEILAVSASDSVRKITDQSRGWPAVLGLAALTGSAPPEESSPSLYEFFADEMWKAAEPRLQMALTTLALLPGLESDLVSDAFGEDAEKILEAAHQLGAISKLEDDSYELHPLLRDFLITKLREEPAVEDRVERAIALALNNGAWDTALLLAQSFPVLDFTEYVFTMVYRPMLQSGRIATLIEFAEQARHSSSVTSPSFDLADAELALRDGDNSRAEQISVRVARQLPADHALRAHAYTLAGHASFASWNSGRAKEYFERARQLAPNETDTREALWGLALTAMYDETGRIDDAVVSLRSRRDVSDVDFVRYATVMLARARKAENGLRELSGIEDALYVARRLDNPLTRTSFISTYAYVKGLQSLYDAALTTARDVLHDAETFSLAFVVPHAHWDMAFAYLGLRLFSLCDKALQRVEQYAATTNDLHHILNTRCLRARLCLCTGQLERAASEVAYEPPATPTDGMLQEFLATRALVNVSCATDETSFSVRDREPTTVEAATLLAMARAIHAARRNDGETVFNEVALCNSLDTWDAFVCAVRAEPRLLRIVARDQPWRSRVESILARSRDVALARTVGIQLKLPVSKHAALLSPREGEVFELLRGGLTNREIARALFISEATAKVHVRHVMEKLNAKTRTEAANRILASPEG